MGAETIGTPLLWGGFLALVGVMLALDLGVFHRKAHAVSVKEAALTSAVWVALAAGFNVALWFFLGQERALEFTTGYLIEKSLAVDNLFVILVLFGALGIPPLFQHRVLFWGVLGAVAMRGAFIVAGSAFLHHFHWAGYVFGVLLAATGVKLFLQRNAESHPEKNVFVRAFRRLVPMTSELHGGRFTAVEAGKRVATPLLLALVAVEASDLVFAVDSVPAIFAVTQDPFIVFTSNIFAILGLRSLYFLLAGVLEKLRYLKVGLAAILVFVGAKMLLAPVLPLPALASFGVIVGILAVAVVASLVHLRRMGPPPAPAAGSPPGAGALVVRPANHSG